MNMKTLCRFNGENDIWLADYPRRIFGVSAGLYIDADFNIYDWEDSFVPHPESYAAMRRAEAEYAAERSEYIRDVCGGLISFSEGSITEDAENVYGVFGFRNELGDILIEPQYVSVGEFSNDLCPVCVGRTGYHDENGERIIRDHWGYIDPSGKMVIPAKYHRARSFNKYGLAVVYDEPGGGAYLIDTAGIKVPNSDFTYLSPYYAYRNRFIEFSLNAKSRNSDTGDFGLYDTRERRVIFPPRADAFFEWDEEHILVQEHGSLGIADKRERYIGSNGENLYPQQVGRGFSEVKRPNGSGLSVVGRAKFTEVSGVESKRYKREQRYGVLSREGKLLLDTEYTSIRDLGHNIFSCAKGDYISVIEFFEEQC